MATKKAPAKRKTAGQANRTGQVPRTLVFIPRRTNLAFPTGPSAVNAGRTKSGKIKDHKKNPITAAQVEALASVGFKDNEIAVALDIRPGQLRIYYGDVLRGAPVRANYEVAMNVLEAAKGRDVGAGRVFDPDMAKYWLTHRAGFKPAQGIELTGKDGEPLQTGVRVEVVVPQSGRRKAPKDPAPGAGGEGN